MAALKASSLVFSIQRGINVKAKINIPSRVARISLPGLQTGSSEEEMELQKFSREKTLNPVKVKTIKKDEDNEPDPMVMVKLHAILEAATQRVEMHKNVGDQRNNWNSLFLTSINSLTLAAATMAGIAAVSGGADNPSAVMKHSSTVMYVAATGLLSAVNKIQPSQLAEEQRNAARLFKQLENEIRALISVGNPTAADVTEMMEKVLALDEAYPLPLLGAMIEKFPDDVEPAGWWPEQRRKLRSVENNTNNKGRNGWSGKLEEDLRQTVGVLRLKDKEDYLRLGKKALNLNKLLAISGPALTGLAAIGSALAGSLYDVGGWAVGLAVAGGALATVVNTVEHGGQIGMVFEMYRNNAGFFKLMEELVESNLSEEDLEKRENGEVFEMKVALQLGRSLAQLRNLAAAAAVNGEEIDEFASKLF